MANSPQARKRIRQTARRTAVNKARRSRVRTFIRSVEEAIASGDSARARDALRAAESEIMRAARKGIFHRNTGSRKVSRLSHRVKSLEA